MPGSGCDAGRPDRRHSEMPLEITEGEAYAVQVMTETFERLFVRLVGAFKRHDDTPRTPSDVPALGAARLDLELARGAIADERTRMRSRPPNRPAVVRKTAVSDADLARLFVAGIGSSGRSG